MFPIKEDSFFETKLYIYEKILKQLTKSTREYRGIDATADQLEQDKVENRETAAMIADERGAQYMFLYAISKSLKNYAYQALRPLVWSIEAETVTPDEMKGLYESMGVLLAQTKPRSEIELDIKEALRPYVERNSTHMRRELAKITQQAEKEARARQEAEQRTQNLIFLLDLKYDQLSQPSKFGTEGAFEDWRVSTIAKLKKNEKIDEDTQKLVDSCVEAYRKSKESATHSDPAGPSNHTQLFTPSSSSSSLSRDIKSIGKFSKSFLTSHSIHKKRKPSADKENEKHFEENKLIKANKQPK